MPARSRPRTTACAAIMRAHVASIPFENLDVQLGRPITGDLDEIFAKLVERRRGGWCYEQNGLLGWALETIGFEVTRVAGGVMRADAGDAVLGNHLALVVTLDQPWLVDAGFGGSLAEPIALAPAAHRHAPYDLSLAEDRRRLLALRGMDPRPAVQLRLPLRARRSGFARPPAGAPAERSRLPLRPQPRRPAPRRRQPRLFARPRAHLEPRAIPTRNSWSRMPRPWSTRCAPASPSICPKSRAAGRQICERHEALFG